MANVIIIDEDLLKTVLSILHGEKCYDIDSALTVDDILEKMSIYSVKAYCGDDIEEAIRAIQDLYPGNDCELGGIILEYRDKFYLNAFLTDYLNSREGDWYKKPLTLNIP